MTTTSTPAPVNQTCADSLHLGRTVAPSTTHVVHTPRDTRFGVCPVCAEYWQGKGSGGYRVEPIAEDVTQ